MRRFLFFYSSHYSDLYNGMGETRTSFTQSAFAFKVKVEENRVSHIHLKRGRGRICFYYILPGIYTKESQTRISDCFVTVIIVEQFSSFCSDVQTCTI